MRLADVEREAEAIAERARAETEALAERIRAEVVAPLCRDARLEYVSGNGSFAFFKRGRGEPISDAADARRMLPRHHAERVAEAFAILALTAPDRFELGHYVRDVRDAEARA